MSQAQEINFDGLVGPTHNFAGLSHGNVASLKNAQSVASPKTAALQGLAKIKALKDMGLPQAVLAPMERPAIWVLRSLGFTGTDAEVLSKVAKQAPELLVNTSSASSMWTANACTTSPSADTHDGKVHFTPANLSNKFHRSIEHPTTGAILKAIFSDEEVFVHHPALPSLDHFGDEGAANHTRFCHGYGNKGLEFFVFGKYAFDSSKPAPRRFPARQTYEACQAIARLHGLDETYTVIAQQNPDVIDAGVFHNDVIAVGNGNVLFCHEQAFLDKASVYETLQNKMPGGDLQIIEVPEQSVSVSDAVSSYLFNSQLVNHPDGGMMLICPGECESNKAVASYLDELVSSDNAIKKVHIYDVRESMRNGGGPACLRQRVVLTDDQIAKANQKVFMTDELYATLTDWVERHYRDRLIADDLADPQLLIESRTALDELTQILGLGSVYPFQGGPT